VRVWGKGGGRLGTGEEGDLLGDGEFGQDGLNVDVCHDGWVGDAIPSSYVGWWGGSQAKGGQCMGRHNKLNRTATASIELDFKMESAAPVLYTPRLHVHYNPIPTPSLCYP